MATIGLSRPYIAKYINTDGVITYEGGKRMGKAVEVSVKIESGDASEFTQTTECAKATAPLRGEH